MYRKAESVPSEPLDFELPKGCKLAEDNRWVKMAQLIPWLEFESDYAENFPTEMGAPAKSFRMALGALIIKEKLGISDIETVEQIRENPYLQQGKRILSSTPNMLQLDATNFLCSLLYFMSIINGKRF